MTDTQFTLLLVEDSDDDALFVERAIKTTPIPDCAFSRKTSFQEGLAALTEQEWDVVVIDLVLPDSPEPSELFNRFQQAAPTVPIIAMSGLVDERVATEIINQGAHAFLAKDRLDRHALHSMIHSALNTKRLQQRLHQRSHEIRLLVQSIGDGIVVIDNAGLIRFANPATEKLLGTSSEPLIGTPFRIPLTSGLHSELEFIRPDQTKVTVDINVVPILWEEEDCFLASLRDISERKRLESERIDLERTLLAHQKIESLGLFAGGIAHDFNNLLAGIIGHAEVLTLEIPEDVPAAKSVEMIKQAGRRAATLCEQLQAYAGKGTFHPTANNLNQLIRSNEQLLLTSVAGHVGLKFSLEDRIPAVLADPSQITQVLMNLVINAKEAIGDKEGEISIVTRRTRSSAINLNHAIVAPEHKRNWYVSLDIKDTGCGMTPATISRMLEPLYSTKDDSRGLGLSTVQGIIQGHSGILLVDSTPGLGTTFSILLAESYDPPTTIEDAMVSFDSSWRYSGNVLVVDDEPHVREVTTRMLQHLGCCVTNASSGTEALALLENPEHSFDVVFLDLSMPIQSGPSTLRAIRHQHTSITVILMSGFEEAHSAEQIGEARIDGFLRKPFGLEALGAKLRSVVAH